MPNPFFDANRYLWDHPQAQALHQALYELVSIPQKIDLHYRHCSGALPPLNLGQNPQLIWKEALEQVAQYGLLRALCEDVRVLGPRLEACVQVLEKAEPGRDKRVISDQVLMLDRAALRGHLALLEQDSHPLRVLLVRGGKGSGKSYGRYLFQQSARDRGAELLYIKSGLVATVDDVVYRLFGLLDAEDKIPPRADTTLDAWYKTVCVKLRGLVKSRGRPLWIAFDNLGLDRNGVPLLDKDIKRFCDQFALNLLDPSFGDWFRLMLIHYPDGKAPAHWERALWQEDICAETDVTAEHVADLLRAWSVQKERAIHQEHLASLAAQVIAEAEAPPPPDGEEEEPPPRLQRINDALHKALRGL